MITAIVLGYVFFDEIPNLSVWMGAPLVICAGLIVLWREHFLKKQISRASPEA